MEQAILQVAHLKKHRCIFILGLLIAGGIGLTDLAHAKSQRGRWGGFLGEMMMRKILFAAMIGAASLAVATSPALAQAAAAPATGFSVETTDLGTLLGNEATKAILVKHLPSLVGNDQIQMASALTLKQLQGFAGDAITDEKLAAVQADFDKLSKK